MSNENSTDTYRDYARQWCDMNEKLMKILARYRLLIKLLGRVLDYSEPVQHYKHIRQALRIRKLALSILEDYESNPIEVSDD